jgi:hypothetical protein
MVLMLVPFVSSDRREQEVRVVILSAAQLRRYGTRAWLGERGQLSHSC